MHATTETARLLHHDHHRTIGVLNRLEAFLKATSDEDVASTAASSVGKLLDDLRRLTQELPPHFDFEERFVFPLLDARGAYALTAALNDDHDVLRLLAKRVGALCALAMRDNFDIETWLAFRAFASDMAQTLFLHLQSEEITMLAALDRALDTGSDRAMAASYRLTMEHTDVAKVAAPPPAA